MNLNGCRIGPWHGRDRDRHTHRCCHDRSVAVQVHCKQPRCHLNNLQKSICVKQCSMYCLMSVYLKFVAVSSASLAAGRASFRHCVADVALAADIDHSAWDNCVRRALDAASDRSLGNCSGYAVDMGHSMERSLVGTSTMVVARICATWVGVDHTSLRPSRWASLAADARSMSHQALDICRAAGISLWAVDDDVFQCPLCHNQCPWTEHTLDLLVCIPQVAPQSSVVPHKSALSYSVDPPMTSHRHDHPFHMYALLSQSLWDASDGPDAEMTMLERYLCGQDLN